MRTRESLAVAMQKSEAAEERIYRTVTRSLYRELQEPLRVLYDVMVSVTSNLRHVTASILQSHPEIIKILRYCLTPSISQMRLGQIVGLDSTEIFEEQRRSPTSEQAAALARWFADNLDAERFSWVAGSPGWSDGERGIAEHFAKLWTVSLVSNQNTATKYRNLRKERQEMAIADVLSGMGWPDK